MVFVTPTATQWVEHLHHKSLLLLLLLHSHIQTTRDRNERKGTDGQAQAAENQVLEISPRSHHISTANSKSYRDRVTNYIHASFQSVLLTFSSTYSY